MNELERELAQRLAPPDVAAGTDALRDPILTKVNRELRIRRLERLATRIVLAGFLLAAIGNWASNRHETNRMARWFPNAQSSPLTFADDETVLVQNDAPQSPHRTAFEQYVLAFYPPHTITTNSLTARETAAWLDEFNQTGRGL